MFNGRGWVARRWSRIALVANAPVRWADSAAPTLRLSEERIRSTLECGERVVREGFSSSSLVAVESDGIRG
jgi:hypothetical protein